MMSKEYVSDFEKYMDQYLKEHPLALKEQRQYEEVYWAKVAPVSGFFPSLPEKK